LTTDAHLISRRGLLAGAGASALSLYLGRGIAWAGVERRWISATPRGTKSGTTYANAAPLDQLDQLIAAVGPGGIVLLDAGRPFVVWSRSDPQLRVSHGGSSLSPVTVRGANPDGSPAMATLRSDRVAPGSAAGSPAGGACLELCDGAANLILSGLRFENMSRAVWITGTVPGLRCNNIVASNVDFFLEVNPVVTPSGRRPGALPGLAVDGLTGRAFSRHLLSLRSVTDATITNVDADSGVVSERNVIGLAFLGNTAAAASKRVLISRSNIRRCQTPTGSADYYQGDGISTEEYDSGITIRDVRIADCFDGGVDLKSASTRCERVTVTGSKRSFRYHVPHTDPGSVLVLADCVSLDPRYPGGTGCAAHIQVTGHLQAERCTFATNATVLLADASEDGSVGFLGGGIYPGGSGTVRVEDGWVTGVDSLSALGRHP
jgi:hypothetical protein